MISREKPHIYLKYSKQFKQSKWEFDMAVTYVDRYQLNSWWVEYSYTPSPLQKLLNSEAKKFVERLNQK